MADEAQPREPNFEDVVSRLEHIARTLETGNVPLEQALSLFEEGVKLAQSGTRRLDDAERRLEKLLETGQVASFTLDPPAGDAP
jgi:exodeoxyribonuclease VII small subunit